VGAAAAAAPPSPLPLPPSNRRPIYNSGSILTPDDLANVPADVVQEQIQDNNPVNFRVTAEEGDLYVYAEYITLSGCYFGKLTFTRKYVEFYADGRERPLNDPYYTLGVIRDNLKTGSKNKKKKHYWYSQVRAVHARRFNFLEIAIEIFKESGKSYLYNLFTQDAKNRVMQRLKLEQRIEVVEDRKKVMRTKNITQKW
jgi:hypothetical protein